MNRPIAILLLVLIIVGFLFSTFALFQGKFVEALLVYPLLVAAYIFSCITRNCQKGRGKELSI
jgi:hypothetical protein